MSRPTFASSLQMLYSLQLQRLDSAFKDQVHTQTPWIGVFDAMCMVIGFFFFVYWICEVVPTRARKQDRIAKTAQQYSIHVTNLPRRLETEHQHAEYAEFLRSHFRDLVKHEVNAMKEKAEERIIRRETSQSTRSTRITIGRKTNQAIEEQRKEWEERLDESTWAPSVCTK